MTVKYPEMRKELVLTLKELSDFDSQQNWCSGKNRLFFWHKIIEIADTLLEELDLSKNANDQLSYTLENQEEVQVVEKAARAFESTIDSIGDRNPNLVYYDSPLWQEVVQAAKAAYDVLMIDEDLDELIRQEKRNKIGSE